jgi:hypothetical protein
MHNTLLLKKFVLIAIANIIYYFNKLLYIIYVYISFIIIYI